MTTFEHLEEKFGVLMTLAQLAALLDRSASSVRIATCRNDALGNQLKQARRKIGRRLYFRTAVIAELIDGGDAQEGGR